MRHRSVVLALALVTAWPTTAQSPWKGDNLQHFPKDITRDALVQRMREFSFALGVRCQYCHTGGDGVSFDGVVFASDDKPAKVKARAMLKMVDEINQSLLTKIPSRASPRVEVNCATCHRGLALPKSLQTTLFEIVQKDGVAPAVARYRELRKDRMGTGSYDFGQWEINELARRLAEARNFDAAIAIYDMNAEFHPAAAEIDFLAGEVELARGNREKAAARYRTVLQKSPGHPGALGRLKQLER